jgi:hypothetical protein
VPRRHEPWPAACDPFLSRQTLIGMNNVLLLLSLMMLVGMLTAISQSTILLPTGGAGCTRGTGVTCHGADGEVPSN